MRRLALTCPFTVGQILAADDTNLVAAGDWSQPSATPEGSAIRGRLLICDTPAHAGAEPDRWTDTAVYLELQEFSSSVRSVRVYCEPNRWRFLDPHPGLRCELRDRKGNLVPDSPGGFGGGMPESCWVTLQPYCSVRMRASVFGGGRLKDGGLAICLASRGWWDVHPNATNEYYLSGTFTATAPTNQWGMVSTKNRDVWYGTLALPAVKIPAKQP